MAKPVIVGFDPGTTSAYAALSLDGSLVIVHARKSWPLSDIINSINKNGRPVIISTDKQKVPEAVKKLAAAFSAKVWSPEEDLGREQKAGLVKEAYGWAPQTGSEVPRWGPHEKDAIAAASACFRNLATGFSKIGDTLRILGMEEKTEEVKNMIITKQAKNIAEAVGQIIETERPPLARAEEKNEVRTTSSGQLRTDDLLRKIRSLENTIDIQKTYIERLEEKLKSMEASKRQLVEERTRQTSEARRETLRDKELQLRDRIIAQLRAQVKGMEGRAGELEDEKERREEFEQLLAEEKIPAAPAEEWTRDALADADRIYKLRDKWIFVKNFRESNSALRYCIALGVKGVIGRIDEETGEKLKGAGAGVITKIKPNEGKYWAFLEKTDFEKALKESERSGFSKWLGGYKSRERQL